MCGGALPWVTDYNHANYAAGRAATKTGEQYSHMLLHARLMSEVYSTDSV